MFWEESEFPLTLAPDLLEQHFELLIDSPDLFCVVIEKENMVVGFLIGMIARTAFSHDPIATEMAWYVRPSARGTREPIKLIKEYENWAERRGCKVVTMVDIHNLNDLGNLYTRLGYELTEKTYTKVL